MDELAQWMGLTKAVNYTGKMAWFRKTKTGLRYICDVKDFDPKKDPLILMELIDITIQNGADITLHKKFNKTSRYMNVEAVLEISGQIHRAIGMNIQTAAVNCISRYVNNLKHHNNL